MKTDTQSRLGLTLRRTLAEGWMRSFDQIFLCSIVKSTNCLALHPQRVPPPWRIAGFCRVKSVNRAFAPLIDMEDNMIYGYARCSTNESKQDINRQIKELKAAGAEEVIFEYEHGDAKTKKELAMLLELAQAGDTIITLEVS